MKRTIALLGLICIFLCGCTAPAKPADIAATTLPVYQFTSALCEGTGLTVTRLITENVSCLHDYSLQVSQVKAVESADLVVISGAGLEDFMDDILGKRTVIDASSGIELLESCHSHTHALDGKDVHDDHAHEYDAHIWLSPAYAMTMAQNICSGLIARYPQHEATFRSNLTGLLLRLKALQDHAQSELAGLSCRELITFHDGFSYMAQAFNLDVLAAVEEESGAESSAMELIELIEMTKRHHLPAIFTETNGSDAAARIISTETCAKIFTLDMAMAGEDYFAAMYRNIDILREALS